MAKDIIDELVDKKAIAVALRCSEDKASRLITEINKDLKMQFRLKYEEELKTNPHAIEKQTIVRWVLASEVVKRKSVAMGSLLKALEQTSTHRDTRKKGKQKKKKTPAATDVNLGICSKK